MDIVRSLLGICISFVLVMVLHRSGVVGEFVADSEDAMMTTVGCGLAAGMLLALTLPPQSSFAMLVLLLVLAQRGCVCEGSGMSVRKLPHALGEKVTA